MIDPPQTVEDAFNIRYGQWSGNEKGQGFVVYRCAYSVYNDEWISHQCRRNNGHGIGGLYCKQHAKKRGCSGKEKRK